jgi:hypothetical protein
MRDVSTGKSATVVGVGGTEPDAKVNGTSKCVVSVVS